MSSRQLGAVVLAAGLGTRMKSTKAKVLHELGGQPLLRYPLAALGALDPDRVVVVVGHQADAVRAVAVSAGLRGLATALQAEQHGTGHAVRCAVPALEGFAGDVLIVYGDAPLVRPETLDRLLRAHREADAALTLLTMRFRDPRGYGRIVRSADGRVSRIVEERDASEAERRITEVNPGFYCVRAEVLLPLLAELRADNAQAEYYLTDIVELAAGHGHRVHTLETDRPDELAGINSRAELAAAEARLRAERAERLMVSGVTVEDPATAYIGPDVEVGPDTVIGPNVTLRGRTRIGRGCRIDDTAWLVDARLGDEVHVRFASVIEDAEIGTGAIVGPFARLRAGTRLGERVHLGNFVETKQAVLGAGTKANHMTYLGDCEVGPDTNVGAGTITCNYDGFAKHRTRIGARVQIGSDTQLVAPVAVGDDAYVGAGTTVTRDVPAGALVVTRADVRCIEGWTARRRARAAATATKPPSAPKPPSGAATVHPTPGATPGAKAHPGKPRGATAGGTSRAGPPRGATPRAAAKPRPAKARDVAGPPAATRARPKSPRKPPQTRTASRRRGR